MRALRVAPLLLALSACVVNTDELEPKSSAECLAQGLKACGFKCVPMDDPATGCGDVSCAPCPGGGAHTVAYCLGATTSFCDVDCEYGYGDCDFDLGSPGSNGCERNVLQNDAFNCGACGNVCASLECTRGACKGAVVSAVRRTTPVGIRNVNSSVYVLDPDVDGGSLWNVETQVEIAMGLGETRWMSSLYGYDSLVASGTVPDASPYGSLVIYDIANLLGPPSTPASLWTGYFRTAAIPGERIEGIDVNPGGVNGAFLFSTNASNSGLYGWDPVGGMQWLGNASGVLGFATWGTRTFYGVNTSGGEIRWMDVRNSGGTTTYTDGSLAIATGIPTRLAVFENTYYAPVPRLFWISEVDGSVRSTPVDGSGPIVTHVPPQPDSPLAVDITADSNGVYFTNWFYGTVQMWRPWDQRVVDVGYSYGPVGVAVRYPTVWWTDPSSSAVYTVDVP